MHMAVNLGRTEARSLGEGAASIRDGATKIKDNLGNLQAGSVEDEPRSTALIVKCCISASSSKRRASVKRMETTQT